MPASDLELGRQILAGDITSRAPASMADVGRMIRAALAAREEEFEAEIARAAERFSEKLAETEDAP